MPTTPRRSPVATVTDRSAKSGLPGRLTATPEASTRITAAWCQTRRAPHACRPHEPAPQRPQERRHTGASSAVPRIPHRRRGCRYRRAMRGDGILSDPIDLDRRKKKPEHRLVPARRGLVVENRASGVVGSIRSFKEAEVVLRDRFDQDRPLRPRPGGFLVDGEPGTLGAPPPPPRTDEGRVRKK